MIEISLGTIISIGDKALKKLIKVIKKNKVIVVKGLQVINMSGHPLSEKAKYDIHTMLPQITIHDINIPTIENEKILQSAILLIEEISNKIGDKLLTGEYIVIPPGFSPLAICVFSSLHGVTGHFPKLIFLEKKVSGFSFTAVNKVFDLDSVRDKARTLR